MGWGKGSWGRGVGAGGGVGGSAEVWGGCEAPGSPPALRDADKMPTG